MRTADIDYGEDVSPTVDPPPGPDAGELIDFPFFLDPIGYQAAMEVRYCRGGVGHGFATAWMRMRYPLVAGEQPSPAQRTVCAVDSGSGVSARLDTEEFAFLNPDLTVYIQRPPGGAWIGMNAVTSPENDGIGIADTHVFDESGPIGRATQSLLITRR